jgi:WD40 repeat protein
VALSPDGQVLATAFQPTDSLWDPTPVRTTLEVKLWDVSRSPAVLAFPGRNPPQADFLPDGKHLAETDRGLGRVRVWDLDTGRLTTAVDTTQKTLEVISPDGRYMAGANVAGPLDNRFLATIRTPETDLLKLTALLNLWDSRTNSLRQVEACKGVVAALQFSPDGKRIALAVETSVGDGKELKVSFSLLLWDVGQSRVEAAVPFANHTPAATPVFSPDGKTIALLAGEGEPPFQKLKVLLVDVPTGKALPPIDLKQDSDNARRAVRFTPDGTRLVIRRGGESGTKVMWDWTTGERSNDPVPDVFGTRDVSPDGRYQLRVSQAGVEVIDRTVKPPAVVSHRRQP